ncbi:MAG TPA: sulfatase [Fimbriimonadaceae bacterium]|nr:sulfatase [Fimbriimonadaceae bacterium]
MRILYIDIDSLRPDHLGCYGYHRKTSPNIDALAAQGAVVQRVYASDTPCLPSRTGFFGGQFGSRSGVVNHGGLCADVPVQGADRDFRSRIAESSLASLLTRAGDHTASVSPFPRRHSAYQVVWGFHETYDTGRGGLENADEIFVPASDWLKRNGEKDDWFLHVNMWDPHTPYDTPESFGSPFKDDAPPDWVTQEIIDRQRTSYGLHSAREVPGNSNRLPDIWRWGRGEIKNLDDAKAHFDGYDAGVLYADSYVGRLLEILDGQGVLDETAVIVAADHGENLGELNVWGDHQTADEFTNHIPCIVRWPGVTKPSKVGGLWYHLDLAATIIDLAGGKTEEAGWQGRSMRGAFQGKDEGRIEVYLSNGAWSLQRSLRWGAKILIHTVHTGLKDFSEWMLFDLASDPHETNNIASEDPEVVKERAPKMKEWFAEQTSGCPLGDPFDVVMDEGGPLHANHRSQEWANYLDRLDQTGRKHHADWLRKNDGAPRPSELALY